MNKLTRTTCIGVALVLHACSGSDLDLAGGLSTAPRPNPLPSAPPPPGINAGGLWQGTLQFGYNDEIEPAFALITDDGRFQILSLGSNISFAGDDRLVAKPYDSRGRFFEGRFDPAYGYDINL